jgi:hypothetical protein
MDRLPDELLRIVLAYMPWKDRVRCGAADYEEPESQN